VPSLIGFFLDRCVITTTNTPPLAWDFEMCYNIHIDSNKQEHTMYRSQADRIAEAARAQQITEQRIQEIQDRNPKEAFDAMMNKPEIQAVFKRLAVR
jgi:hypothetical protein